MKKFFKGIRGKQILISGLAVLVMVAGYYRWSVERPQEAVPVVSEKPLEIPGETIAEENSGPEDEYTDYFARARYERDCARSEAAELLTVASLDNDDESQKTIEKLESMARYTENEATIENMVIAKGYSDCVAFVDENSVRVVVKSDSLESESVAQIKDIVIEQTGAKTTEIKISNKK